MTKFEYTTGNIKYIVARSYRSGHTRRRELGLSNLTHLVIRIEQLYGKRLKRNEVDVNPDDIFHTQFLDELERYFID